MSALKNLTNFPFAAIIGQEEMKLALQLNVIDPKIGGVMIMGDRGTGKSTTIRALADLLPDIAIIKNAVFVFAICYQIVCVKCFVLYKYFFHFIRITY
jgi:magnesium chelatase subunit I